MVYKIGEGCIKGVSSIFYREGAQTRSSTG